MTARPIRFMIIDDEPMAHRVLLRYCEHLPDLELANQSYDAFEAMEYLRHHAVDLMFLDIHMPGLNGFEFLRTLKQSPDVIVTTAHEGFALEGYELNVLDYLLKPFRLERFLKAVNKVKRPDQKPPQSTKTVAAPPVMIKGDKKHHRLDPQTILYVEACGNYCYVVTGDERIFAHQTLTGIHKLLTEPQFLRVHKSYLVSVSKITAVASSHLELGEAKIPIGQTYKAQLSHLL